MALRPWQSTQAAPRPLCWMGSMVLATSRGRRRPVRRAGACSGVTAGPAQPSRAALRISGCRSGRLTGTSIGCLLLADYLPCAAARRAVWRFGRARRGGSGSLTGSACAGMQLRRRNSDRQHSARSDADTDRVPSDTSGRDRPVPVSVSARSLT